MQVLIEHGHDKNKVLREYSRDEITIFYEKCIKQDMRHTADFIDAVGLGIGMAFGGSGKKIQKIVEDMRS